MKKYILLSCTILTSLLMGACTKQQSLSHTENITKGSKWALKTGSAPAAVYAQLQALGQEKEVYRVALVYRSSYANPQALKDIFGYYDALTVERNSGRTDRVVIQFDHNKVKALSAGGGLLESISVWPQSDAGKAVIHPGDTTTLVYEKLTQLYQKPYFHDYTLTLPDKPLNKAYDPDMGNYNQWTFSFIENKDNGQYLQQSVWLYFKQNKLARIKVMQTKGQSYD